MRLASLSYFQESMQKSKFGKRETFMALYKEKRRNAKHNPSISLSGYKMKLAFVVLLSTYIYYVSIHIRKYISCYRAVILIVSHDQLHPSTLAPHQLCHINVYNINTTG